MARLGLAERSDLAQWGTTQGAPADLPRLVRRLILETAPGLATVGFAAGEGVYGGDWDGTVRATGATVKVPDGLSLWELSTRGDVKRKADADYAKRTSTPDGTPTKDATYVAVSTRNWQQRDAWAREQAKDGRWREVRAYGVDDLESWLEDAPVTHAWISEIVGLQPHGLVTAQSWWEGWSKATEPSFPAAAILAGREGLAESLRNELAGAGQLITISGASRDDVLAFLTALAINDAASGGGALLARAAFIDRVEAWRRWRDLKRPLVLAPFTAEVAAEMTLGTSHHLIVPVVGGHADFDLPPIDAQAAAKVLHEAGLDEERADEVGRLARLSLLAARRRIAAKPELHRPPWAAAPVERLVRRVILAGRFNEGVPGDVAVIGELLGVDYDSAVEELVALAASEDPLLARLGASLGVVSPVDAWLLVAGALRKEDLEAFHVAAFTVLTESDPRLELERNERWQAGVLGKGRAYSSDLRRGLPTTLALLGAYGDEQISGARLTGREWAGWIVREILDAANKDKTGRLWASLDDVVPLLAEAAPDELVDAVRSGLAGEEPLLRALFIDDDGTSALFASSSHSGLLWALETCSWSPDHFGAVVDLLARWADVDPGGRYANRPEATLVAIFRPWYPQASVSDERRLAVIDGLRARHAAIAWRVLLSLLPEMHGVAMPISSPRYRSWKPGEPTVTRGEYWSFVSEVSARVLEDADADPERLARLVDGLPNQPPEARDALFARLEKLHDSGDLTNEARSELWSVMRAEAAKNREFAEAVWALPEADVARLEAIAARYEPTAPTTRFKWLFEDHLPSLPGVDRSDGLATYASAIAAARAEAAGEIAAECDWDELYAFARSVKVVWFLGPALAEADVHDYEVELLGLLDSDDVVDLNFASSYFGKRFRDEGWAWLEELIAREGLAEHQRARLLLATDDYPAAWERLADAEVSQYFWREFRNVGLGPDFPHVEHVARELYGVGRYAGGLDIVNLYLSAERGPEWADLVATGLERLLEGGEDGELRQLSQYGLRNLFSYLEQSQIDEARLARLEWAYLPAFEFEPAPPTLSRHLASAPEFFVDIVSRVFRPGDEDEETEETGEAVEAPQQEPDEQAVEIARNAYRLLSEWRTLPGRQPDGSVDGAALRAWVEAARAGLEEAKRLRIGDNYIGKLLAASPADADGAWPAEAVRDLLEELQSPEVEDGMRTEIFNSLGVTSRGVLDGGDQERDRSATYREQAQRFVDRWPRTAAVLRDAADSIERMGRDHDDDAERRRTGFDY